MPHLIEYIFNLVAAVALISSLFVFKNFWSKSAQTIWVRVVVIVWMLISQIYWYVVSIDTSTFNSTINTIFYWELCNIVAWASIVLMIIPNELLLKCMLPLALIGPSLTIVFPTEETKGFSFADFRYYQFYFGHSVSLFGFLYIYLYGFTDTKFDWQMIRRSYVFSFAFLTFVEVWNLLFMRGNRNPLSHPEGPVGIIEEFFYPNYIFRDIINNIGLARLNVAQQYFIMILLFGPILLLMAWTVLYFVRPISLKHGTIRTKFNIHDEPLEFKNNFSKENIKLIWNKILKNIKSKEIEQ